jgi:hypothetical protein
MQQKPSLSSQCTTLEALNTLLQQQLDGAREDFAHACAQIRVLQLQASRVEDQQPSDSGAITLLYGQLEKARVAQQALEKQNEKLWAEVRTRCRQHQNL